MSSDLSKLEPIECLIRKKSKMHVQHKIRKREDEDEGRFIIWLFIAKFKYVELIHLFFS
jgi:hypothetical protein